MFLLFAENESWSNITKKMQCFQTSDNAEKTSSEEFGNHDLVTRAVFFFFILFLAEPDLVQAIT